MASTIYDKRVVTDSADLRRVTFPGKPKETQTLAGGDPIDTAGATQCHVCVFRTHVQIFMVSTGQDSGSSSEMIGFVEFPTGKRNFSKNLPDATFFNTENGGLGRRLFNTQIDTAFAPANFRAYLKEDDDTSGDEIVMDKRIDWTNPANLPLMDGSPHVQEWHNTDDIAYRANVWFQVTQLS